MTEAPDRRLPSATRHRPGRRVRALAVGAAVLGLLGSACAKDETTPSGSTGSTSGATAGTTAGTTAAADWQQDLDSIIEQAMSENAIPGAVVIIENGDEGTLRAVYGTSTVGEDDPPTFEDSFRIGSNTKTMTSTVILQLAQEGALSLDDPVSAYIDGVPNGENITIANLSEMRSGLPSYSTDDGFNKTLDEEPEKVWTPEELLAIAYEQPIMFEPGEEFFYSNTNIILLGLIIEQLTGMTASEAFAERIFEPLGLEHTSLPEPDDASIPDPHPQGYMFGTNESTNAEAALPADQQAEAVAGALEPNDVTDDSPSWGWTAGAAISTADDMVAYTKALVDGDLLDPEMQQTRVESIVPMNPDKPEVAAYGLGIARLGPALYGHDGQIPGFMSVAVRDPDKDLTIVILTNLFASPDGEGAALSIFKPIVGYFYGASALPADPAGGSTTTTAG